MFPFPRIFPCAYIPLVCHFPSLPLPLPLSSCTCSNPRDVENPFRSFVHEITTKKNCLPTYSSRGALPTLSFCYPHSISSYLFTEFASKLAPYGNLRIIIAQIIFADIRLADTVSSSAEGNWDLVPSSTCQLEATLFSTSI